ncbi:hypothetical protein D0Z00_004315 [Geotrichum galactomycetum]|uniref:Uncharacterized protein n=1 Tax=Geotrichum galactomycetum TaxID=27317 RepID=A0ACB6UYQ9_9ASCO|nr:hypothetical protein D0Z00_004315 [Geotrichum candidum]
MELLEIQSKSFLIKSSVGSASDSIEEKLKKSGLNRVDWHGKCNPDELLRGSYDVVQGGTYAFVFDNTFSKNTSKTIYFSQRVTTGEPANKSAVAASTAPTTKDVVASSSRSLPTCISDGRHLSGVLLKKRRKKLQGYARRLFALDYKYGTLNYYTSENSSILRGSMPIKLSVVSVREKTKEIFIDSGMEVWNLRALNDTDLKTWVAALEVARLGSSAIAQHNPKDYAHQLLNNIPASEISNRLSTLLTSTPITNDAVVKSLAAANAPKNVTEALAKPIWNELSQVIETIENIATKASNHSSNQLRIPPKSAPPMLNTTANTSQEKLAASVDPLDREVDLSRRKSFWRRRTSRHASAMSGLAPDADVETGPESGVDRAPINGVSSNTVLMEVSADLFTVAQQLKTLLQKTKDSTPISKKPSFDASSIFSEEFFDAEEQGIMYLDADEEFSEEDEIQLVESRSTSDGEEEVADVLPKISRTADDTAAAASGADYKNDLYPLTVLTSAPKRRNTVPMAVADPPNFLTLIRKNVGKDLSTIAMPVTANEPITILQRFAEMFESTSLIDTGLSFPKGSAERIMHIATFGAVFSASNRIKDRSGRKPFNPLLGETFELVRKEQGMRLIAEKVSHRPPIMAMQADAEGWSIQYAPSPHQKIWGKSVELNTKGTVRLTINTTGEVYEWEQPTTFMRNIIAGEKYTEPVGKLTVVCSNGWRVVYEYKAGGMFSGRSEDMSAKVYSPDGKECAGYELEGKWTASVSMKTPSTKMTEIWTVGPLVENHHKRFGFTQFAANLNEITEVERDKMAPTDSRLRPDQDAYERGDVDVAQELKLELEQRQRERRTELETNGQEYQPVFFERQAGAADDDNWVLKRGPEGYWERRKRGDWTGLIDLF